MIDVCIPEGALAPDAEARLMCELTEILLRHEGLDPASERALGVSLIFLLRPTVYVAGAPASAPRYRVIPTVPEGQYGRGARGSLVHDVTAAFARAEGRSVTDVAARVWVFPTEMPDGNWGSRGVIRTLGDILEYMVGEHARPEAASKLSMSRSRRARALFAALLDAHPEGGHDGPVA
ncbi:MAG: Tautomerase enzyme [Myxococcaceae bacterium]|nr:Tautomerase enzyme [Myxococcaceae bacterium]